MRVLYPAALRPVLADADVPHSSHCNQSAYPRNVSCADAIFATQETISRYISDGSNVFMCLYDLQKAFDSVEYPILFQRLLDVGVNGRCWRLIRSLYKNAVSRVRIGNRLSKSYVLERGVKQGSILSPALFLLVMDPLLSLLESSRIGLSINNLYAGGFIHADDIRTLASSSDSLQNQIKIVEEFCKQNFLQLNVQKCEVVAFSLARSGLDIKLPDGVLVPQRKQAKSLGYWWERDLLANCCVEQNIRKARSCFFHYGSLGSFQGDINPLSTKSVIDTCVMPVLLYACENWVLTDALLRKLACFLGWAAKRALKWPVQYSNTAALVCLGMESIK